MKKIKDMWKIEIQKEIAKKEYEIKLLSIELQNIDNQTKPKKIWFEIQ